jgi:hypothetical protein
MLAPPSPFAKAMSTTIDLGSFIGAPAPPKQQSTQPLPPKVSFTLWVTANPFVQTFAHFAVALAIAIIEFILCFYVIEPSVAGFFPVSSFITDILFLIILVLGARIVIDRQFNKRIGLQTLASFCASLHSAILHGKDSEQLTPQDFSELGSIPVHYLLCLRAKTKSNMVSSDVSNENLGSFNAHSHEVRMFRIAQWCKTKGIDFSRCLEHYESAAISERYVLTRDMNGFTWVCAWLYVLLVPFVLWGFYDVVVACIGLLSVWAVLALAHGFNRNMHFYDLYRKHAATPFDLMSYVIEQSKIITLPRQ